MLFLLAVHVEGKGKRGLTKACSLFLAESGIKISSEFDMTADVKTNIQLLKLTLRNTTKVEQKTSSSK
jgi:hypothetical protein